MLEMQLEISDVNLVQELQIDEVKLDQDIEFTQTLSTKNYNVLDNKPSINGTTLVGNYDEIDPTVPAWAKEQSPSFDAHVIGAITSEDAISLEELSKMFQ